MIVAVVVLPVVVNVLGVLVIVHEPAGRLLSTTEPVALVQVGCVIAPTVGLAGVTGCVLITTVATETEEQPAAFLILKVYVPAANPLIVVVAVLPVVTTLPGLRVNVQLPDGRPVRVTEPVATEQVGCAIVPTVTVAGIEFGAAIPVPEALVQPLTVAVTV